MKMWIKTSSFNICIMEKDVFIIMPHEYFLHRVKLQVFETFDAFKFHNQVIISSTVIDFANDMFYIIFAFDCQTFVNLFSYI